MKTPFALLLLFLAGAGCFLVFRTRPYIHDSFIEGNQKVAVKLRLKGGYTSRIVVEQCGADFLSCAISPRGVRHDMDRTLLVNGEDFCWVSPERDEEWVVEITPQQSQSSDGYYQVRVENSHPREAGDDELLEIHSLWEKIRSMKSDVGQADFLESAYCEVASFYLERGDVKIAADSFLDLAFILFSFGKYEQCQGYCEFAIELYESIHDLSEKSYAQGLLGMILLSKNALLKDAELSMQSLDSYFAQWRSVREAKIWDFESSPILGLGAVFGYIGMYEESISTTEMAIDKIPRSNHLLLAMQQINLASLYLRSTRNLDKAFACAKAAREHLEKANEADQYPMMLRTIAAIYSSVGRCKEADSIFNQALKLNLDPNNKLDLLFQKALNLKLMGDKKSAENLLRDVASAPSPVQGAACFSLGQLLSDRDERVKYFKTARDLAGNTDDNAPLISLKLAEESDDVNSRDDFIKEAIALAEQRRGRYSDPNLRTAVFQDYYKIYSYAIDVLLGEKSNSAGPGVEAAFNLLEEANGKCLRESLFLGIRKSRPVVDIQELFNKKSAAWSQVRHFLTHPLPVIEDSASELEDIQAALDAETLILVTSLRVPSSHIWYIWDRGYRWCEGPSSDEFQAWVSSLRKEIDENTYSADSQVGKTLFAALFPSFLDINKFSRLAIVADESLSTLPFSLLPDMAGSYLVKTKEIVYLPTASHAALAIKGQGRPSKPLAVFANPIFSRFDQRLSLPFPEDTDKRSVGATGLPRLAGTEREAASILSLVSHSKHKALYKSGLAATREAVLSPDLENYKILHFATHCLIDPADSSKSKLIFSCFDKNGRPIPSELTLADISEMKLKADLVVLSACETALGKRVRGAGPMSISRGFMLAGVPHVAATLWNIDDKASPVLMKHFYSAMLEQGMTASAALCDAQRKMLRDPQWRAPKYWSAFILLGDWR